MTDRERRYRKRVRIDRPVSIELDSGETLRGRAVDLSVTGMGIVAPQPIAAGAVVGVRLLLSVPGRLEGDLHLTASVSHSTIKNDAYGIGLEFARLSESDQSLLTLFLDFRDQLAAACRRGDPPGPSTPRTRDPA